MRQLDRYVLGQLLGPFGFFALVFTIVIWLTQSLRIVDTVVNNNQSGAVFLELSALLLPAVIAIVIPVAAFAGTLLTINRLYSESELVVMMAAGQSGASLARPVFVFGLLAALFTAALTLYLMPLSANQLRDRTEEIRAELASSILQSGRFSNPMPGLTIYLRESASNGEMGGIFIHDARKEDAPVTYTAKRARFVQDGDLAKLIMYSGTAQQFERSDDSLSVLDFDQLVYDLGPVFRSGGDRKLKPEEFFFTTLISPPDELWEGDVKRLGELIAEGHDQLASPLYALALPLLSLAIILARGFRRGGFAVRIGLAVVIGTALRFVGVGAKSAVVSAPASWPILYLPPLFMIALSVFLLVVLPRLPRRAPPVPA